MKKIYSYFPYRLLYFVLWLGAFAVYGAFYFWYESLKPPLSRGEIIKHLALYSDFYHKPAKSSPASRDSGTSSTSRARIFQGISASEQIIRLRGFLDGDDGGEVFTFHLVRMRAQRLDADGVSQPYKSVFDLFYYWQSEILGRFYARASYPIFIAPAISLNLDEWGIINGTDWTHILLMRHRSRRDLMELINDSNFARHHHLLPAMMESQISFAVSPLTQLLMLKPIIVMMWIIFALACLLQVILLVQAPNSKARDDLTKPDGQGFSPPSSPPPSSF